MIIIIKHTQLKKKTHTTWTRLSITDREQEGAMAGGARVTEDT